MTNCRDTNPVRVNITIDNPIKEEAIRAYANSVMYGSSTKVIPYNTLKDVQQLNNDIISTLKRKLSRQGQRPDNSCTFNDVEGQ